MLRRFLLVGLFVIAPYNRGSLMQLAIALLTSVIYLLIQQHAKPFLKTTDDYVAISSSFSLVVLFVCCVYYRFSILTELKAINDQMSYEQRQNFVFSTVALAVILFVAVIGALGLSIGLAMHQLAGEHRLALLQRRALKARRLRYKHDDHRSKNPEYVADAEVMMSTLERKYDFHLFLSQCAYVRDFDPGVMNPCYHL